MSEPKSAFETAETWILRGSGSWLTLGLVGFLAAMGITALANGAPREEIGTWSPLLASCALAFMFVGTRTTSKLVQRVGIVLFMSWLGLLVTDIFA